MDQTDVLDRLLTDMTGTFNENEKLDVIYSDTPHAKMGGTVAVTPEVGDWLGVDDLSGAQELRLIINALSHEVEHVRQSDLWSKAGMAALYRDTGYGDLAGKVMNILEDQHVDWNRTRRFKGLRKSHAFFVQQCMRNAKRNPPLGDKPLTEQLASGLFQTAIAGRPHGFETADREVQEFLVWAKPLIERCRYSHGQNERIVIAMTIMDRMLELLPEKSELTDEEREGLERAMENAMTEDVETPEVSPDAFDEDELRTLEDDLHTLEDQMNLGDDEDDPDDADAGDSSPDADEEGDTTDDADPDASEGDDSESDSEGDDADAGDSDENTDAEEDEEGSGAPGEAADSDDDAEDADAEGSAQGASEGGDSETDDSDRNPEGDGSADANAGDSDVDGDSEIDEAIAELSEKDIDDSIADWTDAGDSDFGKLTEAEERRYERLQDEVAAAGTDMGKRKQRRDKSIQHDSEYIRQLMRDTGLAEDVTEAFKKLVSQDREFVSDSGHAVDVRNAIRHMAGDYTEQDLYRDEHIAATGGRLVGVALDMSSSMKSYQNAAKMALAAIWMATKVVGDDFCATSFGTSTYSKTPVLNLITAPDESFEWEHLSSVSSRGWTPVAPAIVDLIDIMDRPAREKLMFVICDGKANVTHAGNKDDKKGVEQTAAAAMQARHDGIKVLGLGIGRVSEQKMKEMFGERGYLMADTDELAHELVEAYRRQLHVTAV